MTANSKVVKFGPPPSGRRPTDTFYSLATRMLKDALKEDPSRWWMMSSMLFSESYPLEDIAHLGYQQFGCTKCGSKQLPQATGMCQLCFEQKFPPASNAEDSKPEEPPTLKPLKYAAWRAPKLPEHSSLVDLKTTTYYSRLLVTSDGFYTRRGQDVGGLKLCGYRDNYRNAIEPLPAFFIRNQTTRITKSYAQKDTSEVAQIMEQGAKRNLDALFQVRIETAYEQEVLEEIDHQLRFVDRVIQKGHLKGQVRAIFRNLERYLARQGK